MSLKKETIKNLKAKAATQALTIPANYDKRFKNSWLHLLGEPGVEPVLRKEIVHISKEDKKVISKINWAEISAVING